MNENIAWQKFEQTGTIEDYMNYIKVKNKNMKFNEEIGSIKGDISEDIQSKRNSN